jgi:hypothetical protein
VAGGGAETSYYKVQLLFIPSRSTSVDRIPQTAGRRETKALTSRERN